jgi:hypothetical protein
MLSDRKKEDLTDDASMDDEEASKEYDKGAATKSRGNNPWTIKRTHSILPVAVVASSEMLYRKTHRIFKRVDSERTRCQHHLWETSGL